MKYWSRYTFKRRWSFVGNLHWKWQSVTRTSTTQEFQYFSMSASLFLSLALETEMWKKSSSCWLDTEVFLTIHHWKGRTRYSIYCPPVIIQPKIMFQISKIFHLAFSFWGRVSIECSPATKQFFFAPYKEHLSSSRHKPAYRATDVMK